MSTSGLLIIAAVFVLAGFVKGTIGLGLPTVAIGLLATRMPPIQAAALVIAPSIATNIWQTFGGPYLRDILRRLWPLLVGTTLGVWSGSGLMSGPYARFGVVILGIMLILYAIIGLGRVHFQIPPRREKSIGAVVGLITGLISATTGIQIIPSVPFIQATGMEKDELIQALGVFFTIATLALAFNLTHEGVLTTATALPGGVAMTAAFGGMAIGQVVRSRMEAEVFRRWFLIAMLLLGVYLIATVIEPFAAH